MKSRRFKGLKLNLSYKYKSSHTLRILHSPETLNSKSSCVLLIAFASISAISHRLLFHSSSSSFHPSIDLYSFSIPSAVSVLLPLDISSIFTSFISPPDEAQFAPDSQSSVYAALTYWIIIKFIDIIGKAAAKLQFDFISAGLFLKSLSKVFLGKENN